MDVETKRDEIGSGLWMEARAAVEGVPVCAEVLLSVEAAAVNVCPVSDLRVSVTPSR